MIKEHYSIYIKILCLWPVYALFNHNNIKVVIQMHAFLFDQIIKFNSVETSSPPVLLIVGSNIKKLDPSDDKSNL